MQGKACALLGPCFTARAAKMPTVKPRPDLSRRGHAGTPDMADKFGADFVAEPPDDPVDALLGANAVAGKQQDEVIGHIEALDVEPHAAVGNIGDEAVARQRAAAELDFCHPVDLAAPRPASLVHGRRALGSTRSCARPSCCGRASRFGDSPGYPRQHA